VVGRLVFKKKVTLSGVPYLSLNLPTDTTFAVIREDSPTFRAGLDDFWGGEAQADTYPLVVPLRTRDGADATQHPKRRLSKEWFLFVRDLNSYDMDAVSIIFKVEAGWINGLSDPRQQIDPWQIENMDDDEMPKPEFIVSSGTVVNVLERTGSGVRIDAFDITDKPPLASEVDHETASTRIVHFMSGHKNGYYTNISSGSISGMAKDVYFPVMAPGEAWVPFKDRFSQNRIEFFPKLPQIVLLNQTLTVRVSPDIYAESVGYIQTGHTATITQYYPCPTGVWGRVVDGWIAIQYLPYKGYSAAKYFTNWRLESIPPLRPKHV
jgi:hypothetical protein